MRRPGLLIALLVLVAVGVPVLIALAGGGGDEPSEQAVVQSDDEAGTPPAVRPGEETPGDERGRGGGKGRADGGDGPPAHAGAYDEQMAGVAYPANVTEAGSDAAATATRVLGREVTDGQRTVFAADCRSGTCTIRYRSTPRGGGSVTRTQVTLLKRLFARDGVSKVVLYVHHTTVGRGKEERPAFQVVTCERGGYDWSRLTAKALRSRCDVSRQAGGKLRNEVRRGRVSVEDASRGREGSRPVDPAPVPGGGSERVPRKVDGSAAAERRARERE